MRRFPSALVALSAIALVSTNCLIVDPGCGSGGASILITPSVVFVGVGQSTTPRARGPSATVFMVTGLVLLIAAAVDAISRRRATASGRA